MNISQLVYQLMDIWVASTLWVLLFLRQEIDGPQAAQLESVPCGQILQDKDNSGSREELSPAQIRDKETPFLILEVKEAFLTTHTQNGSSGVKGEGTPPIGGDVNLPTGLFARIHLG